MARKFFLLVQFDPLSVFLAIIRWSDKPDTNWELAFIAGGCIAAIESFLLSATKMERIDAISNRVGLDLDDLNQKLGNKSDCGIVGY